ncbi:DUF4097 family beta strand repeat-containing protein [Paraferrimonas sedimenticola]|uniref:DUF4097 domain-containing protein n=1 Tax=Paraferrimonas sedimenticola TaxID=375674 RepID=A0AA37RUP8_9GAMM|nr:DUF4097 family beta strand repeat-containing protein [Paraferrimonas sedimenticola]GLP95162.1 hypothetical protein GCM10007895_04680 [Paraferrimonas sedimenticola]
MKIAVLLSSLMLALPSWAQDVDKSLPINSGSDVRIEVPRGELKMVVGQSDQIRVSGTLDEMAEELIFEQQGNAIVVEVRMPGKWRGNNKDGSNLTIEMPAEVNLDASGVSTNIRAKGFSGDIDISTVSGELMASELNGKIGVNTVSGDLTLRNSQGRVRIEAVSGEIVEAGTQGRLIMRNVSGDITSTNDAEEVSLETVSGDVEMRSGKAAEMTLRSVSGDMELALKGEGDYRLSSDSVSGDMELSVNKSLAGSIRFFANAGGKIKNRVSDDKPVKQKYGPSSDLEFELGQGSSKLNITTLSGTMEISYH